MTNRPVRVLIAATAALLLGSYAFVSPAEPPADAPASASPQPSAEKLPDARQVINRHVKAIGGVDALRSKKSIHTKSKLLLKGRNIVGDVEVLAAPPNKLVVKSIVPVATTTAGFDGTTGWIVDSRGARLADANQLPALRERADFLSVLHDDKHFKSMTNEGIVNFDNRKCYKIKLVRHDDEERTEYYDVETGLLAGRASVIEGGPTGSAEQTVIETDYKKFGDLLFATRIIRIVEDEEVVMTVHSVEFDTLEPSTFELPAEVKALLEKPADAADTPADGHGHEHGAKSTGNQ